MKRLIALFYMVFFIIILISSLAEAGPEEDAIAKNIKNAAKALTDFPKTRDAQYALKFYANDYFAISDGQVDTLKQAEDNLAYLKEQINLGNPVGLSMQISNIKAEISGTIGWATYDYTTKIVVGRDVLVEEQGKCTTIHRKMGSEWLIQHEHCSAIPKEDENHPEKGQSERTL
jgi:ketosteroid isomerase-like protein